MGNIAVCCHYDNEDYKDKRIEMQDNDVSYEQNLYYNKYKIMERYNPTIDENFDNLNESSIIGIKDFNSTSYINVNLQVLSRLKFFTDYLDVKIKINENQSLKNLKYIFDNLLKGYPCNSDIKNFISEIGHLDNNNEKKIQIGNDALNFHLFMLDYINSCISNNSAISKDDFKNENAEIPQIEILKLRENFQKSFENEIKEIFYFGIINSSNDSSCDNCKFIFTNFQIISQQYLEISHYNELETFQKNIDNIIFVKKIQETKCKNCNLINNINYTQQILNYPKYLLIKIELIKGLDIDKINDIRIIDMEYRLNNIIFAQEKEENSHEYCVSTNINGVWYHCDNNNVVSIRTHNLLNNSYILYYNKVESTH